MTGESDEATKRRSGDGTPRTPAGPRLSIVAAVSANGVIGRDNDLPWHLPDDLARFRELTLGHPIIMGRRTYESIGRPLDGRTTVVLTRDRSYRAEGCVVVHDLDEALEAVRDEPEAFVVGGEEVYRAALPRADRLYLTRVDAHVEGDARFPEVDIAQWELSRAVPHDADESHVHSFSFCTYRRRPKASDAECGGS